MEAGEDSQEADLAAVEVADSEVLVVAASVVAVREAVGKITCLSDSLFTIRDVIPPLINHLHHILR